MKYDVNYFIRKFENLKDDEVGEGSLNRQCALWHCGVRYSRDDSWTYVDTDESKALIKILGGKSGNDHEVVIRINDSNPKNLYTQEQSRQRILAALYDIKRMQEESEPNKIEESQPKVEYKLVYSDQKVKELVNEILILS